MESIKNILTAMIFWSFTIGSLTFGYIGFEVGSFSTYEKCVVHKDTFATPEFKYSYHNNLFYIVSKYVDPKDFDDVKFLEKKSMRKEFDNKMKTL